MAEYEITAVDRAGVRRKFRREAPSAEEAAAALRDGGWLALSVEEARGGSDRRGTRSRFAQMRPMGNFDVETGLRQIAAMLRSGIPAVAALKTASEQAFTGGAAKAWAAAADAITAGASFPQALEKASRKFGEMTIRLAETGDRSGELEKALSRAADHLEAKRNLKTAVANALAYPLLAMGMAVAVAAYLVCAVIPKLAEFLKSGGVDLPQMTVMLMDFADWINAHGLAMLAAFAAAVAAWFVCRANGAGRELEDALLLKIPVAGRILRLSGTALFARSMQMMCDSGMTLLDSLGTAAGLMRNARLSRRVAEAKDAVMRGGTLAGALRPAREFMPMLAGMAAVGEETGSLGETFGETASFHETMLAIAVKRLGMAVEPVMIVATGLIVGFVYIAFFMALFAMAGAG